MSIRIGLGRRFSKTKKLKFWQISSMKQVIIFEKCLIEIICRLRTAYMLFYEREGLSVSDYLPKTDSQLPPDTKDLEDELEVDFKKHCSVM